MIDNNQIEKQIDAQITDFRAYLVEHKFPLAMPDEDDKNYHENKFNYFRELCADEMFPER